MEHPVVCLLTDVVAAVAYAASGGFVAGLCVGVCPRAGFALRTFRSVLGYQSIVAPTCMASRPCGVPEVRGGSACGPSTLWRSEVAVLASLLGFFVKLTPSFADETSQQLPPRRTEEMGLQ
ncbi:hypothetical protein Taro_048562 [Colocasia esculenta]|uniref:Uncharacterized protein n=1 Tax=Colocasia esculenta TaxID=4460 RepID=A0A843X8H5_COLES|nr:hypothetical protein [Colocasia esculenta]